MFKTFRITLNIGSEIGSALESVEVISVLCDFKATYSVNCSLSQNCPAQLQITDYNYNLHFQSLLDLFVPKLSSSPAVILQRSHKYDLMIFHFKPYDLAIFHRSNPPLLARFSSYGLSIHPERSSLVGYSRWPHRRVLGDLCISPGPLLHLLHWRGSFTDVRALSTALAEWAWQTKLRGPASSKDWS